MADQHRVVFTPSGLSGTVTSGATVLDAARQLGVDLDTVCGGRAICGRCQVTPVTGEFAKWSLSVSPESVAELTESERNYTGRRPLAGPDRLGCALPITADLVVDVPEASQIHRQVVAKSIHLTDVSVDPIIRTYLVDLAAFAGDSAAVDEHVDAHIPSVGDALVAALGEQWDLPELTIDAAVTASLYSLSNSDDLVEMATVAVRSGRTIVGAWPGYVDRVVGAAVDVGSTTLAGHLCDLQTGEVLASAGAMNPQIRFGEDLMSRVSYVMMNTDGVADLTGAIRDGLASLLGELLATAEIDPAVMLDVVLVGNPVMHHLVLGIDPTPLGQAPFRLAVSTAVNSAASELDLTPNVAPGARAYLAPCIAGHVGADTAAAILAEGPHRSDATTLLIDVGTNAEIVLGNRHRVYAASSPTGPAFEGAQISCGQRATVGAIERVRIDPDSLEPSFRVIGSPQWSNEADDAPSVTGICGSGIIEVVAELFLAGLIDSQGVLRPHPSIASDRVVADERTFSYIVYRGSNDAGSGSTNVVITQADVRAIQLAKAALRAGIDLLVDHAEAAGLAPVEEILLAGAFGAHIDPVHAMVLGLIPDHDPERVRAVGNAAGAGAVRALLSAQQRAEMETTAAHITKIETAVEATFQDRFVAALGLPHAEAPSPKLAAVVSLPVPSTSPGEPRRRRRSRSAAPTSQ